MLIINNRNIYINILDKKYCSKYTKNLKKLTIDKKSYEMYYLYREYSKELLLQFKCYFPLCLV